MSNMEIRSSWSHIMRQSDTWQTTHDEKIALQANRIITIGDGKIIKDEVMK